MSLTTQAAPRGLPPGPRWPRAVQTLRFGLDPYGLFESAHRAFGDVFTLRVMAETWVVLANRDAVRELYRHGPDGLDSGVANMSLRPLLGTRNVLLLDGGEHLRRRKLVLPPFHGERMLAYGDLIREATRREVADWPLGVPMPTLPRMHAITLHVVLRAVFGLTEGARLDRLASSLRRLMTWTTDPRRGLVFGFLGPDRLMGLAGFRRQLADVDDQLLAEIASRREAADLGDREDILSLLLRARDEHGKGLSDRELRDELMTLLVAGHETSATALSWAMERLVRHPEALARLREDGEEYADAVIKETLRLRPVLPVVVRRVKEPIEIGGRLLPAGVTVAPCIYLVHRRPDVYPEPLRFRPERFLHAKAGTYTWFPFGGAVRRCLGASFALFEMSIVLRVMARALDLRPVRPERERTKRRAITLVPGRGGEVVAEAVA